MSTANKEHLKLLPCWGCLCMTEISLASRCQFILRIWKKGGEKKGKIWNKLPHASVRLVFNGCGENYCIYVIYPAQFPMWWKNRVLKVLSSQSIIGKPSRSQQTKSKCLCWGESCCMNLYLLDFRGFICTAVQDPNESFVWNLHKMQISGLVEVPALKCSCSCSCLCTRTLPTVCYKLWTFL